MRNIEKIAPIPIDSTTCNHVTYISGIKNIAKPVLINNGGKIIFLTDVGCEALFSLTNTIVIAIIIGIILITIQYIKTHIYSTVGYMNSDVTVSGDTWV